MECQVFYRGSPFLRWSMCGLFTYMKGEKWPHEQGKWLGQYSHPIEHLGNNWKVSVVVVVVGSSTSWLPQRCHMLCCTWFGGITIGSWSLWWLASVLESSICWRHVTFLPGTWNWAILSPVLREYASSAVLSFFTRCSRTHHVTRPRNIIVSLTLFCSQSLVNVLEQKMFGQYQLRWYFMLPLSGQGCELRVIELHVFDDFFLVSENFWHVRKVMFHFNWCSTSFADLSWDQNFKLALH